MPKRKCPYGDNSPLQFKNYIRQKELNEGIQGENEKKKIFEKTKELLFLGARKNLEPSECIFSTRNCDSPMDIQEESMTSGQMCIDTNGLLVIQLKDSKKGADSSMDIEAPRKKSEITSIQADKCDFCDKSLSNLQKCSGCGGCFCSMCSAVNYDENFERIFCHSCDA